MPGGNPFEINTSTDSSLKAPLIRLNLQDKRIEDKKLPLMFKVFFTEEELYASFESSELFTDIRGDNLKRQFYQVLENGEVNKLTRDIFYTGESTKTNIYQTYRQHNTGILIDIFFSHSVGGVSLNDAVYNPNFQVKNHKNLNSRSCTYFKQKQNSDLDQICEEDQFEMIVASDNTSLISVLKEIKDELWFLTGVVTHQEDHIISIPGHVRSQLPRFNNEVSLTSIKCSNTLLEDFCYGNLDINAEKLKFAYLQELLRSIIESPKIGKETKDEAYNYLNEIFNRWVNTKNLKQKELIIKYYLAKFDLAKLWDVFHNDPEKIKDVFPFNIDNSKVITNSRENDSFEQENIYSKIIDKETADKIKSKVGDFVKLNKFNDSYVVHIPGRVKTTFSYKDSTILALNSVEFSNTVVKDFYSGNAFFSCDKLEFACLQELFRNLLESKFLEDKPLQKRLIQYHLKEISDGWSCLCQGSFNDTLKNEIISHYLHKFNFKALHDLYLSNPEQAINKIVEIPSVASIVESEITTKQAELTTLISRYSNELVEQFIVSVQPFQKDFAAYKDVVAKKIPNIKRDYELFIGKYSGINKKQLNIRTLNKDEFTKITNITLKLISEILSLLETKLDSLSNNHSQQNEGSTSKTENNSNNFISLLEDKYLSFDIQIARIRDFINTEDFSKNLTNIGYIFQFLTDVFKDNLDFAKNLKFEYKHHKEFLHKNTILIKKIELMENVSSVFKLPKIANNGDIDKISAEANNSEVNKTTKSFDDIQNVKTILQNEVFSKSSASNTTFLGFVRHRFEDSVIYKLICRILNIKNHAQPPSRPKSEVDNILKIFVEAENKAADQLAMIFKPLKISTTKSTYEKINSSLKYESKLPEKSSENLANFNNNNNDDLDTQYKETLATQTKLQDQIDQVSGNGHQDQASPVKTADTQMKLQDQIDEVSENEHHDPEDERLHEKEKVMQDDFDLMMKINNEIYKSKASYLRTINKNDNKIPVSKVIQAPSGPRIK